MKCWSWTILLAALGCGSEISFGNIDGAPPDAANPVPQAATSVESDVASPQLLTLPDVVPEAAVLVECHTAATA